MNDNSVRKKFQPCELFAKISFRCATTFLISLALVSSLFHDHLYAQPSAETPVPVITRDNIKLILETRKFKSKEELFQLLHILYSIKGLRAARIEGESIKFIRNELKTLFPLDECNLIELKNETVKFVFRDPQKVAIPNTWRQAYLLIPDKLTLSIKKEDPERINDGETAAAKNSKNDNNPMDTSNNKISFKIEKGYIRVHFAFILRLISGKLRDADGTELVYQINEAQKSSKLDLIEIMPIDRNSLEAIKPSSAAKGRDYTWVDIKHPDFPGRKDVGFFENWVSFFGQEVELLPNYMFRVKGGEPKKNKVAWKFFNNFRYLKEYAECGVLNTQINYQRKLGYYLEEHRVLINMGFSPSSVAN